MSRRAIETMFPNNSNDAGSARESVEYLYIECCDRLLRFVTPRVGGDRHVAEDVVQDTFMAALVSLTGFGARSTPFTWLCAIAQHKIADHYRKSLPAEGATAADSELDLLIAPDENERRLSSVEDWFENVETRDMVRSAMRELPTVHRRVLFLKYFEGLSVAEIGGELGRSPKAIEGLLARARQSLSRMLSERVRS